MTTKDEGIGGKNPGKNCFYPYERDTTRGTPNLDSAPSMHTDVPRTRLIAASCVVCGADFGYYREGTRKKEYCPRHLWLEGFFTIESSNIDAFSHDGKDHLYVRFKTGDIYTYWPIGPSIVDTIKEIEAKKESIGKWFNAVVKANKNIQFSKVKITPVNEGTFPAHKQTDYTASNADATQPQVLAGKGVVKPGDAHK